MARTTSFLQPAWRRPITRPAEIQRTAGPGIIKGMKRNAPDGRILDGVADDQFQVEVRIHLLMAYGYSFEFLALPVFDGNIPGCPSDEFMHKPVAFIIFPIQDEMEVRIHQTESEDNHTKSPDGQIHAVHSADEIVFILENGFNGVAVSTEMPAIVDRDVLSSGEGDIEAQIGNDLLEQFFFHLHHHIQRHKRLLNHKDTMSGKKSQEKN